MLKVLLPFTLTFAISTAWSAPPTTPAGGTPQAAAPDASHTEETSAIERTIEARVREMLDGVIKTDKFAVYAQVTLRPDAKVVQEYYNERLPGGLPGLPMPDPEWNDPANNKLYSLVTQKKIIVVLDKGVSTDQESVAREIVKSKLALDDARGDTVDFRRAEVPNAGDRSPASSKGFTADWVKYVLTGLAVALSLAVGILLWQISLLRERVDARAKLKADIKVDTSMDSTATVRKGSGGAEGQEGEDAGQRPQKDRSIQESDPVSAMELKEKILSLAVSNPKAASLVARKLLATREGMKKLAVACEAIGFEYTKQLFDTVSPAKWRAMGEFLRENLTELSKTPIGPVLLEMYTDMLAESMGWDPSQSAEGPFDFLHKLTQKELVRLFDQEDPNNIAFIAAYWEAEEMTQVLAILPDSARKQAVLQIARLQGLPKEVVHQAAVRFAQRLKAIRSRNEVDVDGSEVVARVLGTVDSGTEEELLKFIEREDPATRDRLRAHYFSFDSMHLVPAEVLSSVFETADPSLVTKALVGADDGLVAAVLSVLPSKQRSIVEDDVRLANSQNNIPKHETAEARKILTAEARKAMKDRGIDLASLSGGGHAPAAGGGYGSSAPSAYSGAPTTMMDSPVSVAEADTQGASGDAGIINLDAPPDSGEQAA